MERNQNDKRQEIGMLDKIGLEVQNKCDELGYDIDNNVYYTEFNQTLTNYQFAELNTIKEKYYAQKLGNCLYYLFKDLALKGICV